MMDLKFALRSLGRSPGFTALAVLILTLGIGANTAIFTEALLLAAAGSISGLLLAETAVPLAGALDSEATLRFTTMQTNMAELVAAPRFSSLLLAVFASSVMLLASVGIYGVIAFSTSQRAAEIGLRMALGADPSRVVSMVLSEALKLTGAGLLTNKAGAAAVARLLASQLFEVSPFNPVVYVGMFLLLAALAVAASYLPAWRAGRIEPLEALRQE